MYSGARVALSVDTIKGLEEVKESFSLNLCVSFSCCWCCQDDLNGTICFPLFCSASTGHAIHHEGHRGKWIHKALKLVKVSENIASGLGSPSPTAVMRQCLSFTVVLNPPSLSCPIVLSLEGWSCTFSTHLSYMSFRQWKCKLLMVLIPWKIVFEYIL